MKEERNNLKIIFFIGAVILLVVITFLPLGLSDFILPSWGGGMVHCDPQMSENIWLPAPTNNVGRVWYRHNLGGELSGTWGNGIAGNGRIAACTFNNYSKLGYGHGNLILYDYYGNRIWSDNQLLNPGATFSSPMVDIHDQAVACDNQQIILVNASDRDNVHVEWNSSIRYHNEIGVFPIPFSPTIVENKTIILPTMGGPLLAYNVTTGGKIADIKLGQDGVNESYYGIPDMPMSDFLSIISNPLVCPYHYDNQNHVVEWVSNISYGIMPPNYIFQEGNVVFMSTPDGVVAAFDTTTDELLASNSVVDPQLLQGPDYYSTINSALVNGNRVFLACEKKGNKIGRLYAVDVYPNATNEADRLKVAWYYNYSRKSQRSQATPTIIDDTIYFDGYNDTLLRQNRDPHIYAVYMNGTEKWNVSYTNITWLTFTRDPRGGFWYEDCDQARPPGDNTGGNKLVRFSEENGSIIEEIDMKTLLNDTGKNKNLPVLPSSDMTICGTSSNPIMLISANHQWLKEGKWVIAIDLSDNNKLLWKIPINSLFHLNYANGDYTILTENNQSRILFGTWLGGVMAIGSLSSCWFQDIDYQLKDSNGDINSYNDTVQVNYTIKTSLPDRTLVKATLISLQHPILCRYKTEKHYNISSPAEIEDSLNVTLPPQAPKGTYLLRVFLYNSSGEADRDLINLFDYLDFGVFANDTDVTSPFYLYPLDDPPETPHQPWGVTNVLNNLTKIYATNTTDPNGDDIWYQWRYDTGLGVKYYTRWIMGGPHESGENCTCAASWLFPGTYQIQVRAKDNILQPNVYSDWSPPLAVTVNQHTGNPAPWDNELLGQFTQTMVTPTQQTSCTGFSEGVYAETQTRGDLNWTWSFGDGTYSYDKNVDHNYSQTGTYVVNLTLKNGEGGIYNCTVNVSVVVLKSDFDITGGQPGENVSFSDSSTGSYSLVNWTWDFDDGNTSYLQNPTHIFTTPGFYNVSLNITDNQDNTHVSNQLLYIESLAPQFVSVIDYPDPAGFGQNVTICVDLFDNQSGINAVYVNITYPDNETTGNFSMEANMTYPYDYIYIFNDTWLVGEYNYTIWVVDNAYNTNSSAGHIFSVKHLFGYTTPGGFNQSVEDQISGSVFTAYANGEADNITAYVQADLSTSKAKCMIYRNNDSALIGTTEELTLNGGPSWVTLNFSDSKPTLAENTEYVLTFWSNDTCYLYYDNASSGSPGRYKNMSYGSPPDPANWTGNEARLYSIYCSYTTEPEITDVSNSPGVVGFGFNVTIGANASDWGCGIDTVKVNVSYPNSATGNFTMNNTGNDTYEYVFSDAWLVGQYDYTVWAIDHMGNSTTVSGHSFNVSAQATIGIATLKDITVIMSLSTSPTRQHRLLIILLSVVGLPGMNTTTQILGRTSLKSQQDLSIIRMKTTNGIRSNATLEYVNSNHPAYQYGYRVRQ